MPTVIRLEGALKIDTLEQSLKSIIERHEILWIVIYEEEGVVYQEGTYL